LLGTTETVDVSALLCVLEIDTEADPRSRRLHDHDLVTARRVSGHAALAQGRR
jgi:hypothetical protein